MNRGWGVGLGSAGRVVPATQVEGNSSRLRHFRASKISCCHRLVIADGPCTYFYGSPNLLHNKCSLPRFSGLGTIYYRHNFY